MLSGLLPSHPAGTTPPRPVPLRLGRGNKGRRTGTQFLTRTHKKDFPRWRGPSREVLYKLAATYSPTHSHTHSLPHIHTSTLTLSQTHTHSLSNSLSPTYSHTHSHTHASPLRGSAHGSTDGAGGELSLPPCKSIIKTMSRHGNDYMIRCVSWPLTFTPRRCRSTPGAVTIRNKPTFT